MFQLCNSNHQRKFKAKKSVKQAMQQSVVCVRLFLPIAIVSYTQTVENYIFETFWLQRAMRRSIGEGESEMSNRHSTLYANASKGLP